MTTEKEAASYNCLVVDDEPVARRIVINYIRQMPLLRLTAERINALTAMDYLKEHDDIDIIFLDITMPNLSGLQLMKIIQPSQPVILTTAYSEYAVESYEVKAADYLLKPFSFERFTKAVYRAIDMIKRPGAVPEMNENRQRLLYIKSDGRNYPVELDDILFCEAMKNYTLVNLKSGKKLMPLTPLSRFETVLAEAGGDFIQVHRSYLVSKKHISAVSAGNVLIDNIEIPIGVQFKEKFHRAIGMRSTG